ncbi:U32 family peptidase [uncultured Muribaculum sp.]|uniref:peptidase U32 family protein n=1 Tax=uncultured Muribaculum sp. TaxID=1918613 RepID=UPI0025E85137|nr:U32 family peptidase [uncultured Muribaculum sp.]
MPPRHIELLSPARNADIARAAIDCGADAVYIGADRFGARAAAGNPVDEIAALCDYAHRFDARIYATLNTIIYENELRDAERLATSLWRDGVDALIVQDMAMLRLDLPPIALHASTQCDIRTPEKARFLAQLGFSQLVLPRELTLDEIRAVKEAVPDTALEAFVHGALCVSYSGDCQASYFAGGRSANRGECAQICRLPFTLLDGDDRPVDSIPRHYLSLRDLRRAGSILPMMDAGISSFKIEGRLKDEAYVKNVTAFYRHAVDEAIAAAPDIYRRSSAGQSEIPFTPALEKSFNRGFTSYFLDEARPTTKMASMRTPKSQGEPVGKVVRTRPDGSIDVSLLTRLANGDGLGYFNAAGLFSGFRANRVDGSRIFPASRVTPTPGTVLYRNSDTAFEREVSRPAIRTIWLDMRLRPTSTDGIAIDLTDERGTSVTTIARDIPLSAARTPQADAQRRVLAKLGGTIYRVRDIDNRATSGIFIPASILTALRRDAIALLDRNAKINYRREPRRKEDPQVVWPSGTTLSRHANVANTLAEKVYRDHGVTGKIEPAAETSTIRSEAEPTVMTTRYCLRRELGACLRTPGCASLKGPLKLVADMSGERRLMLRLDFDCAACRMHVVKL